jgi:hypothetical protein
LKRGYAPGGTFIPVEQVTSVRSLANLSSYEFAKSQCSEVFKFVCRLRDDAHDISLLGYCRTLILDIEKDQDVVTPDHGTTIKD